jgi:hypothetical protein
MQLIAAIQPSQARFLIASSGLLFGVGVLTALDEPVHIRYAVHHLTTDFDVRQIVDLECTCWGKTIINTYRSLMMVNHYMDQRLPKVEGKKLTPFTFELELVAFGLHRPFCWQSKFQYEVDPIPAGRVVSRLQPFRVLKLRSLCTIRNLAVSSLLVLKA